MGQPRLAGRGSANPEKPVTRQAPLPIPQVIRGAVLFQLFPRLSRAVRFCRHRKRTARLHALSQLAGLGSQTSCPKAAGTVVVDDGGLANEDRYARGHRATSSGGLIRSRRGSPVASSNNKTPKLSDSQVTWVSTSSSLRDVAVQRPESGVQRPVP